MMRQKGFTLIEMLIVITIFAISLSLANSMMSNYIVNAKLKSTAEEFLTAINLSRAEALQRSDTVKFVSSGDGGWTIFVFENNAWTIYKSKPAISGLTVIGAQNTIRFDSNGRSDLAVTWLVKPLSGNCIGMTCLNIQVNQFGKAKMCNPASTNEILSCN